MQRRIDTNGQNIVGFFIPNKIEEDIKNLRSFYYLRVVPFDQELRRNNFRGLYYCPADIDFITGTAQGYFIENNQFVKTETKIPYVNCNLLANIRRTLNEYNVDYSYFLEQFKRNNINIYPDLPLSYLVADKYKTYETLQKLENINQPYTEYYKETGEQLERFLEQYNTIFLKPNFGNMSEKIIFLKKQGEGVYTEYYPVNHAYNNNKEEKLCASAFEAAEYLKKYTSTQEYIIQEGIDVLKYENSVLKVRVVSVFDGKEWQNIHLVGKGYPDRAVSNTELAKSYFKSEELLMQIFDSTTTNKIVADIQDMGSRISDYLYQLFDDTAPELGYDLLVDKKNQIYVCEVNTRPALPAPTDEFPPKSGVFEILPEEEPIYKNYIIPYGSYLAQFYMYKLKQHLSS